MKKAWVISAYINKNETVALSAKDKISKGHNNNELSRTDNISNNASNVNNNETKFSRDVDVDEFDDTDYNEIRLGKKNMLLYQVQSQ